jgi:hypothetical protein
MPNPRDGEVSLENVRIVFRNFAGRQEKYNDAGKRNFALVLDSVTADFLEKEGWNVKRKPPKEEGEDEFCFLSVTVSYKGRPPRLVVISNRGKNRTNLDEDTAEMLDYAEIDKIDLIIRPYDWTMNGNRGRKAYLKTIYATIHEDDLDLKYADLREIAMTDSMLELTAEPYLEIVEED